VLKQGHDGLQDTVRQLECDQKETLLKCATVWNCNSKNCHPAQVSCSMLSETSRCFAIVLQFSRYTKPSGTGHTNSCTGPWSFWVDKIDVRCFYTYNSIV